jgi:hypothetical protein
MLYSTKALLNLISVLCVQKRGFLFTNAYYFVTL